MSDLFSISINRTDIEKAELFMAALDKKAHSYVKHALNRAVKGVTTDTARFVPDVYNIKPGKLRKASRIFNAGKGGTHTGAFKASAVFRGNKILAKHFSPKPGRRLKRQPARGISIFLEKGKKFTLDGTFFGTNKKGKKQIYKRIGTPFYRNNRKTQNLAKPRLLSVPYMIKMSGASEEIRERAVERFNKNLDHNINRLLSKG